jgi:hypothetical protein
METNRDLENRLREVSARRSVEDTARHSENSRRRLLRILQKKLTTSFIGALSQVESHIGKELWGHGLEAGDCTPEQLAWRAVWEECRNAILNNGNGQVRAVEAEMQQYEVNWRGYRTSIPAAGQ